MVKGAVELARKVLPSCVRSSVYNVGFKVVSFLRHGTTDYFRMVNIETCAHCNRRCSYCPQRTNPRAELFMSEDHVRKIIDELASLKFFGVVVWTLFNEPLLDHRLASFIAEMQSKVPGAYNTLYTNADCFDLARTEELFAAGLGRIVAATHGTPVKKFREMHASIFEKFSGLIDIKEIDEDSDFLCNRGGSVALTKVAEATNYDKCMLRAIYVTCEGNVVLCCNDYYQTCTFGNISDKGLEEIWFSDGYKRIRKELRAGRRRLPVCQQCFSRSCK